MYKCSCGHTTDKEWCPKCGRRNTTKFQEARRRNDDTVDTGWSVMNNVTESLTMYSSGNSSSYDSSSSCDSSSSSGCD